MKLPHLSTRRLVAGAAIVLASGAVIAGPVAAQTGDTQVRTSWAAEALDGLVEDGTLTQAQADAVEQALEAARPERGGRGPGGGRGIEAAATAIGVEVDVLRDALRDGSTIADVAAINGVDVQTVIDAMVAAAQEHLDEQVAAGDLTADEAATRLTEVSERITAMVNGELPAGGPGGFGGRGHGPHGDTDGNGPLLGETPADTSVTETTGS
jgi:polyhydroxyalkanoate synthesis regulator phasin